jgi:ectoine hydroxylase-related dioxygenase (phytanoyl-CoA dioxygenase family)
MSGLTADAVLALEERLNDTGYAVVRGVVSREVVSAAHDQLVAAYAHSVKFTGGGTIIGHLNCFPGEVSRPVFEELDAYGLINAIRSLRKDQTSPVRANVNFNLAGSSAQHYHMDGVFVEAFIVCQVALLDTDLSNGAIDLLPGTHREYYPFWRYAVQRKYRLTTRVPMEAGDVLVRWSTLWHRGMPNKSRAPRPMMSFTFGEQSAPAGDPFIGDVRFYPNWYSNESRMGVAREHVEVAAPITRSTVRFVRSIVRPRGYSSY